MTTNTSALALTLFLAACAKAPKAEVATQSVPVRVVTATSESLAQPVTATGTFGSRDEIPLSFKIGGVVSRVLVDEGQRVTRGQLLASLDLREIDAQVSKAKVALDKAERDQARVQRLTADSVATRTQLDDAISATEAARADYTTARINHEYATITAPDDGMVLERSITAGTTIGAGTPVLRLGGSERGRVLRVGVTDRDALRVRVGNSATVHFDALPERAFTGRVALVAGTADPRTGTYAVEITLSDASNGTRRLPAGLVGRVEIKVQSSAVATIIPVDALIEADADSATVYTTSTKTELVATHNRVRILQLTGDRAAVTGIDAGARVITAGSSYVTDGTRIHIATPERVAAASVKAVRP